MSDRMTSIRPRQRPDANSPLVNAGFASYGRKTRAEMIALYRRHHEQQIAEAQAALALTDDELIVYTYAGVWAQKDKKEVTE